MVIAVGVSWLLLARTRLGLHIYATGGNPQAARVAGVDLRFVRLTVYTISGLLAGLGRRRARVAGYGRHSHDRSRL